MPPAKSWKHNGEQVSMKEIHAMPCKSRRTLPYKRDQLAKGMTVQELLDWVPMSPQEIQRRARVKSPWGHNHICAGSHIFAKEVSNG